MERTEVEKPPELRAMLHEIASTRALDASIRARTEGLTWIIWGVVFSGYALTVSFALAVDGAVLGIAWALVPPAWELLGILVSVGVWRSAAVRFRTDISATRGTLFFVAWWVLFALSQRLAEVVAPPGASHVTALFAFGLLLVGFFALNPLRYTPRGRTTSLVLAAIAAVGAAIGSAISIPFAFVPAYVGLVIGPSWTLAGLIALYRG